MSKSFGQRSLGSGGGFGVTANASRCAVVGCQNRPGPHACPYDGSYHGHGAIHYGGDYPKSSLAFHKGDWYWICDQHFEHCVKERREWERQRVAEVDREIEDAVASLRAKIEEGE